MNRRVPSSAVFAELAGVVGAAASAFHSRWRMSTLQRVDPELHDRLVEQIALYEEEILAGYEDDLRLQAEATVRGWSVACARMQGQADDAYLVGVDTAARLRVVISEHRGSIEHARAATPLSQKDFELVEVSPGEVAALVAGAGLLAGVKQHFPDAELLPAYPPIKLKTEEVR